MDDVLSVSDLLASAAHFRWPVGGFLVAATVSVWLAGRAWHRRRRTLLRRYYAAISYAVVLPGVFMTLLVAFMVFFNRQNPLTDVDLVLMGGPIVAMAACLMFMSKYVRLGTIPGFDNLAGLTLLGLLAFIVMMLILKTRIIIGFFGSLPALLMLFLLLYGGFHVALKMVRR